MFYASRNDLWDPNCWDTPLIEKEHKIWVAQYSKVKYPEKDTPTYLYRCDAWQYTNSGVVEGIVGDVDLDVCYFRSEKKAPLHPENRPPDVEGEPTLTKPYEFMFYGLGFRSISDSVTAATSVELRSFPSNDTGEVVATLENGEFVKRVSVSENSGWSRVIYNGEVLYAISDMLTMNLPEADDTE